MCEMPVVFWLWSWPHILSLLARPRLGSTLFRCNTKSNEGAKVKQGIIDYKCYAKVLRSVFVHLLVLPVHLSVLDEIERAVDSNFRQLIIFPVLPQTKEDRLGRFVTTVHYSWSVSNAM